MKRVGADSPELPQPPKSTELLIAMALSMEREAAARYDELAREMAGSGNHELADLFDELGAEERRHESYIHAWGIAPAPDSKQTEMKWRSPEAVSEGDHDAAGGVHLMTPHRALCLAVHNEERAFALFSNIAAMADSTAVREYAESLAREELDHVVRLRVERRRAWRAQSERASKSASRQGVLSVRSLPALLTRAISVEREAAVRCAQFAAALQAAGDESDAGALQTVAADLAQRVAELEQRVAGIDAPPPPLEKTAATGDAKLDEQHFGSRQSVLTLALADADEAVDFYLAAADAGTAQDMVETAQELAEQALHRLATIKSLLDN